MSREQQLLKVREDMRTTLGYFPLSALEHVLTNRHRLIRREYRRGDRGCLMNLLSETLPREHYLDSRNALTRFFTGRIGEEARKMPEYQPPRYIVRLIDGNLCDRYGGLKEISYDFLLECIEQEVQVRRQREDESKEQEARILARLAERRRQQAEQAELDKQTASAGFVPSARQSRLTALLSQLNK